MNRRIGYSVPLTPQEFYVMAILARRSLHIYAVGQWVEHDSEGMVIMARPTARAVLIRLHIKGSIEVVPDPDNFPAHKRGPTSVSYTHLRAHETGRNLVCRLLLE